MPERRVDGVVEVLFGGIDDFVEVFPWQRVPLDARL
jgi:hypothetical protein